MNITWEDAIICALVIAAAGYLLILWIRYRRRSLSCRNCTYAQNRIDEIKGASPSDPKSSTE